MARKKVSLLDLKSELDDISYDWIAVYEMMGCEPDFGEQGLDEQNKDRLTVSSDKAKKKGGG